MKSSQSIFIGIDIGSSFSKLIAVDKNKEIIGWSLQKSGNNFKIAAETCLDELIITRGLKRKNIVQCVSTGYGRQNVSYANHTRTEISCHAKGCFYYFPFAINVIDIGGQDNKIIELNDDGKRVSFKMNRKCAAGTGAFLEEMAQRLDISIDKMNNIASSAKGIVHLGSFCTVFSATEVLENIRLGKDVGDIIKGLFSSIIKHVVGMSSFSNTVIMTGGVVANNPYLVDMAKKVILQPILIPEYPQLTGALGAALYAAEQC